MKHSIIATVDHYCAACSRKIPAGVKHYHHRAEGVRYHVQCDPDALATDEKAKGNFLLPQERR